jgi:hypothetical protein
MTRHLRTILLRLLVALLLVQGVAAPAWCLERMVLATGTPICTAGGLVLRHDEAPAPHHGNDGCVVCAALPQGPVPEAPVLAGRAALPAAVAVAAPARAVLPEGRRTLSYAARAPPAA